MDTAVASYLAAHPPTATVEAVGTTSALTSFGSTVRVTVGDRNTNSGYVGVSSAVLGDVDLHLWTSPGAHAADA